MIFYHIPISTAELKGLVSIKFWQTCMATLLTLAIFWWNSPPMLVGMQNDIATLMNSLAVSYEVKCKLTLCLGILCFYSVFVEKK